MGAGLYFAPPQFPMENRGRWTMADDGRADDGGRWSNGRWRTMVDDGQADDDGDEGYVQPRLGELYTYMLITQIL